MHQLVNKLEKERKDHLNRIESITFQDVKNMVTFFYWVYTLSRNSKEKTTYPDRKRKLNLRKSVTWRRHGGVDLARMATLTNRQ